MTRKVDLTVSKLLHDVYIMLGMNWIELVNPLIDRFANKMYLPNVVYTAHLIGSWLDQQHRIGAVTIISPYERLKVDKERSFEESIGYHRIPRIFVYGLY